MTTTKTKTAATWERLAAPHGTGEVLRNGNGDVRVWCDSLGEFLHRCDTMRDTSGTSTMNEHGAKWSGTDTYDEANEVARSGWAEPRATVQAHREAATAEFAQALGARWTTEHVRAGGVFDPVRYMVGSQFYWQRPIEQVRPMTTTRVHRINVPIVANSGITSAQMLEAGAAVVALVDVLRILGHTMEIVVSETVTDRNEKATWCGGFLLHRAGDVVDVDAIAYWLAHPSALRRHMFACNESMERADRERFGFGMAHGGYGKISRTPTWALQAMGVTLDVGNVAHRLHEIEAKGVVGWMAEQLEALGVR